MIDNGHDTGSVLSFLRAQGCSVIDSIKIITELNGMSMADAKDTVCQRSASSWSQSLPPIHYGKHKKSLAKVIQNE
jgi:hypothetical protein